MARIKSPRYCASLSLSEDGAGLGEGHAERAAGIKLVDSLGGHELQLINIRRWDANGSIKTLSLPFYNYNYLFYFKAIGR